MDITETFTTGCLLLRQVLEPEGFVFVPGDTGHSSGGDFIGGDFVKEERRLELHFRHSLGRVIYHFGPLSLNHQAYMRVLLGSGGQNHYPGFSADPLDGFRHLQHDLENFCDGFLHGPVGEFKRCVEKAHELAQVTGLKALPSNLYKPGA